MPGAVFGLAAYTNWSNIPSSLLSAFVNANALLSYLPLTFLAEPYTITGHLYALRREVFAAIGGLDGMEGRFDDDHELARRIQRHRLANVQTSVVYDVDNYLSTIDGYSEPDALLVHHPPPDHGPLPHTLPAVPLTPRQSRQPYPRPSWRCSP